jgi:pyruvate kinase
MGDPKFTKIIATMGPASWDLDKMRGLICAGADCFRLNFSHGGADAMRPIIARAREAARLENRDITLLADIQGPKIRIGSLPPDGVMLEKDQPFTISSAALTGSASQVHTPYKFIVEDLEVGARVLFADGAIELRVEDIADGLVHCRVITGGMLFSHKGLNLPGRHMSVETLTAKDEEDLKFIASADIDIVAISFVRTPADLARARELLDDTRIPVMAKLERPEALENLDAILDASDGVMVARGDLGVELPFEQVPGTQKRILVRAAERGKWAVVATQMLSSMVSSRRPTRAEASDVVNAVLDGADAVMLSEETAVGQYPIDAVAALHALTREGERLERERPPNILDGDDMSFAAGAAGAAVDAARRMGARAIVTLAGSGLTALRVSKWRPAVPIVALASWLPSLQRLQVLRGVNAVRIEDATQLEEQILAADRFLLDAGWAAPSDVIVTVGAVPLGTGRETNTIRFHRVRPPA